MSTNTRMGTGHTALRQHTGVTRAPQRGALLTGRASYSGTQLQTREDVEEDIHKVHFFIHLGGGGDNGAAVSRHQHSSLVHVAACGFCEASGARYSLRQPLE